MVNNILIIDTETNGLDVENNQVVEIGAILYSLSYKTILQQISFLLPATSNDMEKINHIPSEVLAKSNYLNYELCQNIFSDMAKQSDYAVAHNADFDKKWFFNGSKLPPLVKNINLKWLCTQNDFIFPRQYKRPMSLVDLAIAHGIGVSTAHRALDDCRLIAELFNRLDNLQELFDYALLPQFNCVAQVSFDDRALAKNAGFRWKPETKSWERRAKQFEIDSFPFLVTKIR